MSPRRSPLFFVTELRVQSALIIVYQLVYQNVNLPINDIWCKYKMGNHINSLLKRHFFVLKGKKWNDPFFCHIYYFLFLFLPPKYSNHYSFTDSESSLLIILSKCIIWIVTIIKVRPKTVPQSAALNFSALFLVIGIPGLPAL